LINNELKKQVTVTVRISVDAAPARSYEPVVRATLPALEDITTSGDIPEARIGQGERP